LSLRSNRQIARNLKQLTQGRPAARLVA
jgi:hypothetical protein